MLPCWTLDELWVRHGTFVLGFRFCLVQGGGHLWGHGMRVKWQQGGMPMTMSMPLQPCNLL